MKEGKITSTKICWYKSAKCDIYKRQAVHVLIVQFHTITSPNLAIFSLMRQYVQNYKYGHITIKVRVLIGGSLSYTYTLVSFQSHIIKFGTFIIKAEFSNTKYIEK